MAEMAVKPVKTTIKRTRRTAKTVAGRAVTAVEAAKSTVSLFDDLLQNLFGTKTEFENLQKEMTTVKDLWKKEQEDHKREVSERHTQEEIERQREKEAYEYETELAHKKSENEFSEKLRGWEKELAERKDEIKNEKKELESLREAVANFENEKEKVVAAAESILEKALTEKFENERRMREQEFKSEKEILNLKLESLTVENQKQTTEIATLQKALNAATAQVKDIAVKVIEAGGAADGRPQGSQLH